MNIDKQTKSINLTKQDAKALAAFAGRGEPLGCVRFEPDAHGMKGANVIATDGFAIVVVQLQGSFSRNAFSVPIDELNRSLKSLGPKDDLNVSGGEGSSHQVFLTAGVSGCARRVFELESEYPKWQQVIPSDKASEKPAPDRAFDSKLLARLALVQIASGVKGGVFSYHLDGGALKAVFKAEDATWTVVVMGMAV